MEPISVKCRCISIGMSMLVGDVCFLPLPMARILECQKKIKILDIPREAQKQIDTTGYLFRSDFSPKVKTRVAWVQNYVKDGGAEISNFTAISLGTRLGFDVVAVNINDETFNTKPIDKCDVVVVNNLFGLGKAKVLDYLYKSGKPWIKYDHDCLEKDFEIYKKSTLNIFISPRHLEFYVEKCGEEIRAKSIVLPLAFDISQWNVSTTERIKDSVFIPSWEKVRINAQEYITKNPDKKYYTVGQTAPFARQVTAVSQIAHDKMRDEYPKYETVLHTPDELCAGERILFEAVLSGCKVVTNGNAGHTSWDFDWRDDRVLRPILQRAIYEFWRTVENAANLPLSPTKSISIITRLMGRKSFLAHTLPTWLKIVGIDEIIIVDWGMKEDLSDLLTDDRITVLQVPDKDVYDHGAPNNIAARYCKSDYLFCIDSDVLVNNESVAFKKLIEIIRAGGIPEDTFITNARTFTHLNGTRIYPKKAYEAVNGFYEGFQRWGFDENDLERRLIAAGFENDHRLFPGMLTHIDHDDALRFVNFKTPEVPLWIANDLNKKMLSDVDVRKQKHEKVLCNIVKCVNGTAACKMDGVML